MPTFYAGQTDYIDKLNEIADGGAIPPTGVTAGTYGSGTQIPSFTVGADGRLSAASNIALTIDWGSVTSTPTTVAGYNISDALTTSYVPTWASISGKPSFATVATTGSYSDLTGTPSAYSLPTATTTILGGVKVDGTSITISSGVISASGTAITAKDEGTNLTTNLSSLNFVGSGVVATNTGGDVTVTISGAGGAGVSDVTASTPLSSTGGATPNITIQVANTSQNGYLTSTDWNTFNGKLSNVPASGVTAGTYGSVTKASIVNIGTDGRVTSASEATVTPAWGSLTGTVPTFNQNTTGTAANVTGVVLPANGGTGLATIPVNSLMVGNGTGNIKTIAPSVAGQVATYDGTDIVFATPSGASLSIPTSTGDVVPSGSLLAISDAGLPMSVDSITTAVIQATASIGAICAVGLSNGNNMVFWRTSGSTDVRMMIVSSTGASVVASTSVATCQSDSLLSCCQMTNGNVIIAYTASTDTTYYRILNESGGFVTSPISITSTSKNIKVCALTGGGWAGAFEYSPLNSTFNLIIKDASDTLVYSGGSGYSSGGAGNLINIAPTPSGGFIVMVGVTNVSIAHFSSTGSTSTPYGNCLSDRIGAALVTDGVSIFLIGGDSLTGSQGGQTLYKRRPKFHVLDATTSANWQSEVGKYFPNGFESSYYSSNLAYLISSMAFKGDGSLVTFHLPSLFSNPPIVSKILGNGIISEEAFEDVCGSNVPDSCFVLPKGQNGFSLIYVNKAKNIKFANIKSGKIIGISLGQSGGNTLYKTTGVATDLTNNNMLNVGDTQVNITRQGKKVFI